MAHIDTKGCALMPAPAPKPERVKPAKQETQQLATNCAMCGGWLKYGRRGAREQSHVVFTDAGATCRHCAMFFGEWDHVMGGFGATNLTYEETMEKMQRMRESDYAMVLIGPRTFAAPDGANLTVELGDIMRVTVPPPPVDHTSACTWEQTKAAFTVHVHVGPYPLCLFVHECSAIGFAAIMQMRADGSIEDAYASTGDEYGHFRPTPEARADIDAMFGSR